jgi:hypothetical protein
VERVLGGNEVTEERCSNGRRRGWYKVMRTEVNEQAKRKTRKKGKKREVVPGIELGLPESESDVLTITLYNHLIVPNFDLSNYNQQT